MQKIAFVSIVLIFGLFSLQLMIGSSLKNQLSQAQPIEKDPTFVPAKHISPAAPHTETNRIIYVFPNDTIIRVEEVKVCLLL